MQNKRIKQISEMLKGTISDIIHSRVKDPRIGFVTITELNLSKDLRKAKVFISVMGPDEKKQETRIGLQNAHAFIQKEMASKLRLRYIPVLEFILDNRYEDYERIDRIIQEVNKNTHPNNQTNKQDSHDRFFNSISEDTEMSSE